MPIIQGNEGLEMVWFTEDLRMHYVSHLSKRLIQEFGNGPFVTSEEVKPILQFVFDNLIQQAQSFIHSESSLAFYQYVQILHEDSNKVILEYNVQKIFPSVNQADFFVYRRVLKFILEQSTSLSLIFHESLNQAKARCIPKLEELIHIGFLLHSYSSLLASDEMLGGNAIELTFNVDNLYILDYKFPYNKLIKECQLINHELRKGAIIDKSAHKDFNNYFLQKYGAELFYLVNLVDGMHDDSKKTKGEHFPQASAFDLESLISNYAYNTEITDEQASEIISGLILNESTKCTIEQSIFQPHNIQRHLYRPIIQWKIQDHPDMVVVSKLTLQQCLNTLAINAIGWEKYPSEWNNKEFRKFVLQKKDGNGKILEDAIERILNDLNLIYDRNVTTLFDKNGQGLNIENEECGEIDFIFIKDNVLFICDSKYLLDRHDFNNWKADYSKFVNGKKNYNNVLSKKQTYLESLKERVFEHLEYKTKSVIENKNEIVFDIFFIVNTPTFYMFNSPILIIPITALKDKINGEEIYPQFEFEVSGDENILVRHPYFT